MTSPSVLLTCGISFQRHLDVLLEMPIGILPRGHGCYIRQQGLYPDSAKHHLQVSAGVLLVS